MMKDSFWWFVKERERVRVRRDCGQHEPWTDDVRLKKYWFPNVRREHDRTNIWFRAMVRDVVKDPKTLLLAIVTFRMFSKIEVGELLLPMLTSVGYERTTLLSTLGPVRYPMFNLHVPMGILPRSLGHAVRTLDRFAYRLDEYHARIEDFSLERSHKVLAYGTGIGPTLAYEIVCDLRNTVLIPDPIDALTWASPTMMTCEAASMMLGTELRHTRSSDRFLVIAFMKELLSESQFGNWEMCEVQRALCLFYVWARKDRPTRRYHRWNA